MFNIAALASHVCTYKYTTVVLVRISGAASHKWMDNYYYTVKIINILTSIVGCFNIRMSTVLMDRPNT